LLSNGIFPVIEKESSVGRSNRDQADRNRLRIIDEADAALRSGGTAAISIADIMARVGMTQGGFYKHFPSREALIAEACSSGFERSMENWTEKAAAASRSVRGPLRRLVEYYLSKKPIEKSCPMVALGPDAAPHLASRELNVAYRVGVEALFKTFTEIAETDPSCSLSQRELTFAFAAMVGANMLARATGDAKWADAVEEMLVEGTAQDR
jgi:TetR/AcrR family transcriptional regulator, transcriptional repressor for nem operon